MYHQIVARPQALTNLCTTTITLKRLFGLRNKKLAPFFLSLRWHNLRTLRPLEVEHE
jgi:hypothetical protein